MDPLNQFDDYDLLRFCRARKFQSVEVKKMFADFITYRSENNIDTLLERFKFHDQEEESIRKCFPRAYHGLDKIGRLI